MTPQLGVVRARAMPPLRTGATPYVVSFKGRKTSENFLGSHSVRYHADHSTLAEFTRLRGRRENLY